jgi:hypothetical protein
MVRCEGRTKHTVRMTSKPINQWYKIFALCDYGYTWSWLLTSRSCGIAELKNQKRLTPTTSAVYQLASELSYTIHQYNVYMDNLFSSIPLYRKLRRLGIGACGTTRTGEDKFRKSLLEDIKGIKPQWNDLRGETVGDGEVLALRWEDNHTVKMLTTLHTLEECVLSNRRKPRNTSTRGPEIQKYFGNEHRKVFAIPAAVFDYNQNKGGVDIADQRRCYCPTQLISRRTWLPLFY